MKNLLLIIITFNLNIGYSQYNKYSGKEDEPNYIFYYCVFLLISLTITYIVSHFEGKTKYKDELNKSPKELIMVGVFIPGLFSLIIGFTNFIFSNEGMLILVLLISKVLLALFTAKNANFYNRNYVLWFLMGIISPTASFIVLGMSPRLLKTENTIINKKLDKLKELQSLGLISEVELNNKKKELSDKLKNEKLINDEIIKKENFIKRKEFEQKQKDNLIEKLTEAFNNEILTKEEFDYKKKQL